MAIPPGPYQEDIYQHISRIEVTLKPRIYYSRVSTQWSEGFTASMTDRISFSVGFQHVFDISSPGDPPDFDSKVFVDVLGATPADISVHCGEIIPGPDDPTPHPSWSLDLNWVEGMTVEQVHAAISASPNGVVEGTGASLQVGSYNNLDSTFSGVAVTFNEEGRITSTTDQDNNTVIFDPPL